MIMSDQAHMMNQPQMMSQVHMMNQSQVTNPVQSQILNQNTAVLVQSQAMNQPSLPQVLNPQSQSQMTSHSGGMNQQKQQQQPLLMMMNQRSYKPWPPQQQQSLMDPNKTFQNQQNPLKFNNNISINFAPSKPRGNKNWKGKTVNNKDQRRTRMEKSIPPNKPNLNSPPLAFAGPSVSGGYRPPSLNDLQTQNRMKARKYYHPKKKFNNRFAPYAPRNTTSFIIRAKKAGGIASLVSPCPVTPAVLPTPMFSPSREILGDMAKEEWGVDGYGSMKGLIRLRSPGNGQDDDYDDDGNGSSESDVEEHVEVERRLDHDLSRFEMIYPNYGGVGVDYGYNNVLENRVDDQDSHIAQLEEENLTLKERLFFMERELGDLRRRMQFLERQHGQSGRATGVEYVNEEIVENVSENDDNESDEGSDVGATGDENNDGLMEYVGTNLDGTKVSNDVKLSHDIVMAESVPNNEEIERGRPKNENAGSDSDVKNEMLVTEDETGVVEIRNEVLMENLTEKEGLLKPDSYDNLTIQDKLTGEKDDTDKETNLEKSIGSGD